MQIQRKYFTIYFRIDTYKKLLFYWYLHFINCERNKLWRFFANVELFNRILEFEDCMLGSLL